jgi:hypothetical protein
MTYVAGLFWADGSAANYFHLSETTPGLNRIRQALREAFENIK